MHQNNLNCLNYPNQFLMLLFSYLLNNQGQILLQQLVTFEIYFAVIIETSLFFQKYASYRKIRTELFHLYLRSLRILF